MSKNIVIKSLLSKEKLKESLLAYFGNPMPKHLLMYDWEYHEEYYGIFAGDTFKLYKYHPPWNYDSGVFEGQLVEDGAGSVINGKFKKGWLSYFIILSTVFLIFISNFLNTDMTLLQKASIPDTALVLSVSFAAVVFIVLSINSFLRSRSEKEVIRLLRKCAGEE